MRFILALCIAVCPPCITFALDTVNQRLLDHAANCPAEAASSVPDLVAYLEKPATSESELVEVFCYWLADNIAYDVAALSDTRFISTSEALAKRKGVCQNYAELLQQMCRVAGIECYVVGGYAKGAAHPTNTRFTEADHAWNVVKVDGKYAHVDATWASGYAEKRQGTLMFRKQLKVKEILAEPDYFTLRHLPADPRWQLRTMPVTMNSFESNDSISAMAGETIGYYNFTDSIAAYRKNDSIQQVVIDAESAYRFNPIASNLSLLADACYNKGWYLATKYSDPIHYRQSLYYYEAAIQWYSGLNNSYAVRWTAAARKSIAYVKARLREFAART